MMNECSCCFFLLFVNFHRCAKLDFISHLPADIFLFFSFFFVHILNERRENKTKNDENQSCGTQRNKTTNNSFVFRLLDRFIRLIMPHIDNDIKLDFKDVLIRPKRSTLKSRADVDLNRQFIFRHSKKTYDGIPIVASNMDTVGTFEMAIQLSKVISIRFEFRRFFFFLNLEFS